MAPKQSSTSEIPRCRFPWRRRHVASHRASITKRSSRQMYPHHQDSGSISSILHISGQQTGARQHHYEPLATGSYSIPSYYENKDNDLPRLPSPPLPPLPPPKHLKIETRVYSRYGQLTPELSSASSATPTLTPFAFQRSNSPATPGSISSSFLRSRSRAGSSSTGTRPPPPPIIVPGPRKGSLPTLPSLHSFIHGATTCEDSEKVAIRTRSSSLPEDSLLPYFTNGPARTADPVLRPLNHAMMDKNNADSVDKAEELQPSPLVSPAFSAHSNARASSHLSRPSSPTSKAAWRQSLAQAGMDNYEESLHNTSADDLAKPSDKDLSKSNKVLFRISHASTVISSPTTRSEAHSVPHEAVQTPRDSYAPLFHSTPSARSDKSFDFSQVPFNLQSMPPPVPRSPLSPRSPSATAPAVKQTSRSAPVKSFKSTRARRFSIASTTTSTRRNNRESSAPSDSQSPRHSKSSRRTGHQSDTKISPPATADEPSVPQIARRPSIAWEALLAEKAEERPFRWKPVKVSEAKKILSPKQLQSIILTSMREYGTTSKHALILENFEEIPLELEQCQQKIKELSSTFENEVENRKSLLARHVACLRALNGDQGARFADTLVVAVSRSDRCAEAICSLREHVAKVERVRDDHWRAAASLSLARLNTSYLKAKDKLKESEEETARLRKERDAALSHVERLKQDMRPTSSLTIPGAVRPATSSNPTPATSTFDFAAFPLPPPAPDATRHDQPPFSAPTVTKSQKTQSPPAMIAEKHDEEERDSSISPGYRFPAMEQHHTKPQLSLNSKYTQNIHSHNGGTTKSPESVNMQHTAIPPPTPPLSVDLDDQARRGLPVSPNYTSRFKAFRDRVFPATTKDARLNSTPPADIEALHSPKAAAARPEPPWLVVKARSNSAPGPDMAAVLDPLANAFSPDAARRKFVPLTCS